MYVNLTPVFFAGLIFPASPLKSCKLPTPTPPQKNTAIWSCNLGMHFELRKSGISCTVSEITSMYYSFTFKDYICRLTTATAGLTHHPGVSLAAAQINKHFEFNKLSKYLPVSMRK